MPQLGCYDFALVVTCGLTRFTRAFPCTEHIIGEETIKILLEEWFCIYGASKEMNSDKDVPADNPRYIPNDELPREFRNWLFAP